MKEGRWGILLLNKTLTKWFTKINRWHPPPKSHSLKVCRIDTRSHWKRCLAEVKRDTCSPPAKYKRPEQAKPTSFLTSSCSFCVKPFVLLPMEWPTKVITLTAGWCWLSISAISWTLSRKEEKIMTLVSAGLPSGTLSSIRHKKQVNKRLFEKERQRSRSVHYTAWEKLAHFWNLFI